MLDSLLERLRQRLRSVERKTIIVSTAAIAGIVAIVGGGVYYSPYLTVNNIKGIRTTVSKTKT